MARVLLVYESGEKHGYRQTEYDLPAAEYSGAQLRERFALPPDYHLFRLGSPWEIGDHDEGLWVGNGSAFFVRF